MMPDMFTSYVPYPNPTSHDVFQALRACTLANPHDDEKNMYLLFAKVPVGSRWAVGYHVMVVDGGVY